MNRKIKYSILACLAVAAIIISWITIFYTDQDGGSFSISGNDIIFIKGEPPGSKDSMQVEIPEGEVSSVEAADTDEKRSLDEKLQAVDGMYPEPNTGYIFVGDSRFVNMNDVCGISKRDNLFMVAKVGEGYSWFSETALQQIKRITSSGLFNKWKLIICLGINDLGNIEKYVKKYEALRDQYDITLVSVNPVNNYGSLSNSQIEKFNSVLTELPFPYIDTYHILMSTGYATTDGLHYSGDTTRKIYNGILLGLEELNPGSLTSDPAGILDNASLGKKNSIQSDILAQNKYVKKAPEPDPVMDEALMQELLDELIENNGEIPENIEGADGAQVEDPESDAALKEEAQAEEQQAEENAEEENREENEDRREEEKEEENRDDHREEEPPPEPENNESEE